MSKEPISNRRFELTVDLNSKYMLDGTATDGEAIIRLRPTLEAYAREDENIEYDFTKLFWNLNEQGSFDFELHFFSGSKDADLPQVPDIEA